MIFFVIRGPTLNWNSKSYFMYCFKKTIENRWNLLLNVSTVSQTYWDQKVCTKGLNYMHASQDPLDTELLCATLWHVEKIFNFSFSLSATLKLPFRINHWLRSMISMIMTTASKIPNTALPSRTAVILHLLSVKDISSSSFESKIHCWF